jgi:arginine/lysine/histidine/glutamine transport system substrate-binding and permease protein
MSIFPKSHWINSLLLGLLSLLFFLILPFNNLVYAQENLTLKVATEPTFPPFESISKQGELEGFDIDLMKAIGQEAGVEVKFESLPFDGIIPALQSRQVDAAISGMTITAERAETVDFSRPYFKSGLAIAIQKSNQDIKSFADLKNKKIAVQIGTVGAQEASKIEGAKISTFDSFSFAFQELINGNVDAVIEDNVVILNGIKIGNFQQLQVVGELITEDYLGIAFPKQSPYLNQVNNALNTLIDNGTYQAIYQKWFAVEPPVLPEFAPVLVNTKSSNNFQIIKIFPNLLLGGLVTLQLTSFTVFLGIIGGTLLALARLSPYLPLRWLTTAYIDFFRGTPLLVQIFMIYFGLPALFKSRGIDFSFERFPAAVTALSLNASAYLAEIIRSGIQSIDRGQWEAAKCLGMSNFQTMQHIIFPQAFRRIIPPLGNEFITMLKDTSLVAVIGFEELFRQGQLNVATSYRAFEIYAIVALIYLILTFVAARFFSWLEIKFNPLKG